MIKKIIINNIGIVLAVLAILTVTVYAWTGPTDAPPRDNVPAPINVSGNQRKDGRLSINAAVPNNYDFRVGGAIKIDDVNDDVSVFEGPLGIYKNVTVGGNVQVWDGVTAVAGGSGDTVEIGKDPQSPGIKIVDIDEDTSGGPYIDFLNRDPGKSGWYVRLWNVASGNVKDLNKLQNLSVIGGPDAGDYSKVKLIIGDTNFTYPTGVLDVAGDAGIRGSMVIGGKAYLQGLTGLTGGEKALCLGGNNKQVRVSTGSDCTISSNRFKYDIQPLVQSLDVVQLLQPVSYRANWDNSPHVGLVAEDVAEVDKRLVAYGEDGKPYNVRYDELTAVLVKAIQEQQSQIENQTKEIEALKTAVGELERKEQMPNP